MKLHFIRRHGLLLLCTVLTAAFIFTACAKENQADDQPAKSSTAAIEYSTEATTAMTDSEAAAMAGSYYLSEKSGNELIPPCLSLYKDGTFSFYYDTLSSYYALGTYSIEDHVLTAKTTDGEKQYLFSQTGDNTFEFIQKGSSGVRLINSDFGTQITDGAAFIKDIED